MTALPRRAEEPRVHPRRDCLQAIAGTLLLPLNWPVIASAQDAGSSSGATSLTLGMAIYDGAVSPFSEMVKAIVVEVGRRADIRIDFKPLPLLRVLESANEGLVDGDPIRIAGVVDRFPNLVQVPTPLFHSTLRVYGLMPDLAQRTRSELRAMRIGKMRGVMNAIKHTTGLDTTDATAGSALLEMLRAGRCDILVIEYVDFETLLKAQPQTIYRWPHAWASEPLYTLLHRRHAALVPRLDAALQSMRRDGRMDRLLAELHRTYALELPPPVEPAAPR